MLIFTYTGKGGETMPSNNKIGVMYFNDNSHVYIYDNYTIDDTCPNDTDKYLYLLNYLKSRNDSCVIFFSGTRRYLLNVRNLLFVKEYPKD